LPRVGEHLIGQIGRAHGARLDLLNAIPERGLGRRLQKRKAGVTEHADEQVIEVVSDAAGEHTEALELLHLLDLLLEAMPRDLRVFRSWMSCTTIRRPPGPPSVASSACTIASTCRIDPSRWRNIVSPRQWPVSRTAARICATSSGTNSVASTSDADRPIASLAETPNSCSAPAFHRGDALLVRQNDDRVGDLRDHREEREHHERNTGCRVLRPGMPPAGAGNGQGDDRGRRHAASSTCRTLRSSASGVNGFCRNAALSASSPLRTTAASV
jgi:predicted pyridoxine 5'-phosphate oxidase superfamily flavin-nucleotide-binding protein